MIKRIETTYEQFQAEQDRRLKRQQLRRRRRHWHNILSSPYTAVHTKNYKTTFVDETMKTCWLASIEKQICDRVDTIQETFMKGQISNNLDMISTKLNEIKTLIEKSEEKKEKGQCDENSLRFLFEKTKTVVENFLEKEKEKEKNESK